METDSLDRHSPASLRKHIDQVKERHKLPSAPGVVTKVMSLLKDPDFNARDLARFISDDPALAARTLSLARSPLYAQRRRASTVHEAVRGMGYKAVRSLVIATAAQSFMTRKSKIGDKLWSHSLATALAARILARRSRMDDPEMAFLAGLLHDMGHMILCEGDPRGFAQLISEVEQSDESLNLKELALYRFDHASVAFALLDHWNLDEQVNEAVIAHHDSTESRNGSLASTVAMADYLCGKAGLGFYGEVFHPDSDQLHAFGCADESSLNLLVEEVRRAFEQENLLFREN